MIDSDASSGSPKPSISEVLFQASEPTKVYVVIDAAKIPLLLDILAEHDFEGACLLPGRLAPDVAAVAPYVILLEPGSRLCEWLLKGYWRADAFIALRSDHALGPVTKHLRGLTVAKVPDGSRAYFRFYDPRVLRAYLPTCTDEERTIFFGDVVRSFWADAGGAVESALALEFDPSTELEPARHPVSSPAD
ncbi:MAG: DUF4123 domain-containing protein [Planctomycetota bacterium]|nr:DUF4123 domain-containing protein [Planctomycetota bacterium]